MTSRLGVEPAHAQRDRRRGLGHAGDVDDQHDGRADQAGELGGAAREPLGVS